MNEKIVFRNEIKFLINNAEAEYLRRILACVMKKDTYAEEKDYYIRSLYFDTLQNRDLVEKIEGVSERRKIRLRLYDVEQKKIKLEIKNKQNSYSVKETITISDEDAKELIAGNTEILLNYQNCIANKVYAYMKKEIHKPVIMIDYEREAYMLDVENVRITFDKNVRASTGNDFFSNKNQMISVVKPEMCILEVKYDRFLPAHLSGVLSSVTMQNMSISKYMHSRMLF